MGEPVYATILPDPSAGLRNDKSIVDDNYNIIYTELYKVDALTPTVHAPSDDMYANVVPHR